MPDGVFGNDVVPKEARLDVEGGSADGEEAVWRARERGLVQEFGGDQPSGVPLKFVRGPGGAREERVGRCGRRGVGEEQNRGGKPAGDNSRHANAISLSHRSLTVAARYGGTAMLGCLRLRIGRGELTRGALPASIEVAPAEAQEAGE